jgi:integrase
VKGGIRAPRNAGGTWAYRVDLGTTSDGGRNQKQVAGFRSREEAEAALAAALAAYGRGDRRTVAGYLELVWLPAKRLEIDRSTLDQYTWAVRRHIVPSLGPFRLGELEPGMLASWLRQLADRGRNGGGRPLSATSVRLVRKVLSMACEDALERGFLADNPVRGTTAPRAAPSGRVAWTADEARRFLAASTGHRLGAAFQLAIVAGLRRGELLGLRWSDLDLQKGCVRVAQQLMVEGGRARLKPVPERDRRVVPLPPSVVGMLLAHRHRQDDERAVSSATARDDLVFRAPGGGWLTPERFARVMNDLIEQTPVPRITPDGLRNAGPLLGHRDSGSTKPPV